MNLKKYPEGTFVVQTITEGHLDHVLPGIKAYGKKRGFKNAGVGLERGRKHCGKHLLVYRKEKRFGSQMHILNFAMGDVLADGLVHKIYDEQEGSVKFPELFL